MDNVMQLAEVRAPQVRDVRANLVGELVLPGDSNWTRRASRASRRRPAARGRRRPGERPRRDRDRPLGRRGRIPDHRTGHGHNAPALGDLSGTVLVKMHKLKGVSIDPDARIARVNAGAIWIEVVHAAAEHGLAALAGSSPDVGVIGYTLGGASRGLRASTASVPIRSLRSSS